MQPDETTVLPAETDAGSSPAEVEAPVTETEVEETPETQTDTEQETSTDQAEPEETQEPEAEAEGEGGLSQWQGSAAARLRELCKLAPGLDKALAANPKLRDSVAAAFKRDAALRDRNVTIAEIDEYRARCVNGLQDLDAMERSLQQANQLDDAFFTRDREGNYPGHSNFIRNLIDQDPEATKALLRRSPKDFAQFDPEGYSETFGQIMASTFNRDRIKDRVADLHAAAKEAGNTALQNGLADVYNYLDSFGKKNAESPEAERYKRELGERDRRDAERREQDERGFHDSLIANATRNHRDLVNGVDLIKKLPQAISKEKRGRIVDDICKRIEAHLGKSFSFKRDIAAAYVSRDAKKWHEVDRNGWQPWIVNHYVRKVLSEETPGIIQGNQAANAKKKAAAARTGIASRSPGALPKPAASPSKKLSDFSPAEIIAGLADHLIH